MSPEHMYMNVHVCPSLCITWRTGESQGSLLARIRKRSKRSGLAQGHPSSIKTWGAAPSGGQPAPPKCLQFPLAITQRQRTPRAGAYGSAFPVTIGKQNQGIQPCPSAGNAPALRNAEAALTCGCTRFCKCAAASAHAHSLSREHQVSGRRASCAPATCPLHPECPMCLQER